VSDWVDRCVLVTGATGFVGGALARRLLAEGAQVRVLARSSRKAAPLAALGAHITEGDISDPAAVLAAAEGAEIVFHVAALMGGPLELQRAVNVDGTRYVMQAAALVGARRVVHVSTIAVYGNVLPLRVTEDVPLGFGASPYAITKAAAEVMVRHGDVPYSIARPAMIFGPGSHMWTANAFRLARLRPTPFLGEGEQPAPAIYIDDLVDLLLLMGAHPAAENETFNAILDPAPTWREFIGAYARLAGHDDWLALPPALGRVVAGLALLAAPRYSTARDFPDMINLVLGASSFDVGKARRLLAWEASTTPEAGAGMAAAWLRECGLLTHEEFS
jgi:nucleoside-diphosphate-sugar epimerase